MAAELGQPSSWIARQLAQPGWVRQAKVVLTCRLNVWSAEGDRLSNFFDVYRNLDFEPEQVVEFINKWFAEESNANRELHQALRKASQRINSLIRNPLRLTLLCLTWKGLGDRLPETKAGLYQRLVDAHYRLKSDNSEFSIDPDDRDRLHQQLGELAKKALDSEESRFRLRQSSIIPFLGHPDKKQSLFWWALKLGWLNAIGLPQVDEKDADESIYAFFHPTFQEYFAALAINNWHFFLDQDYSSLSSTKLKDKKYAYRIFEPQWQEVILLWFGFEQNQKDESIKDLISFSDEVEGFYNYRAYFLAAIIVSEYKSCSYSEEIVKQIFRWRFVDECPLNILAKSDSILRRTDPCKVVQVLVQSLEEPQHEQALLNIAKVLGEIPAGRPTAKKVLEKLNRSASNPFLKREVSKTLMAIETGVINNRLNSQKIQDDWDKTTWCSNSVNEILNFIKNKHRCDELRDLIEDLGKVGQGNQEAAEVLVDLIKTHWSEEIVLEAAISLGKIYPAHPESIDTLCKILSFDRYYQSWSEASEGEKI